MVQLGCFESSFIVSNDVTVGLLQNHIFITQSLFVGTIEMNEKCQKQNHTCHAIARNFSNKTLFFFGVKSKIDKSKMNIL